MRTCEHCKKPVDFFAHRRFVSLIRKMNPLSAPVVLKSGKKYHGGCWIEFYGQQVGCTQDQIDQAKKDARFA